MGTISEQAAKLRRQWQTDPRWAGIERTYSPEDVIRLRGPVVEEHTLARLGATRLWDLLHSEDAIAIPGAASGSHAVQLASQGLHAVHLPGSSPSTVRRINKTLLRAGQVAWSEQGDRTHRLAPVIADAHVGPGGALNAFELMTAMIEAGTAAVHFEDRLPQHSGGQPGEKVLIPTGQHIKTLNAARLAADVLDVPALIIARTAAASASLLSSDVDERDHEFLTGQRTAEGFHRVRPSLYACVTRGLAYAPYADLLWLEAETPDLAEARAFAQIIHSQYPDKMLAYSCAPACDWDEYLDEEGIARFRRELAAMGYQFQFTAPAGHVPSHVPWQDTEFAGDPRGHDAARHHLEPGTRYFDLVTQALAPAPDASPVAHLEAEHFVGHDQVDHHGRLVPAD